MNTKSEQVENNGGQHRSEFWQGCGRAFWTLLGPLLLLGVLSRNLTDHGGWWTRWDALVPGIVAAMIGCRWLEQRGPEAKTAYGDPSTPAHFRRYVAVLTAATALAWLVANTIANHTWG